MHELQVIKQRVSSSKKKNPWRCSIDLRTATSSFCLAIVMMMMMMIKSVVGERFVSFNTKKDNVSPSLVSSRLWSQLNCNIPEQGMLRECSSAWGTLTLWRLTVMHSLTLIHFDSFCPKHLHCRRRGSLALTRHPFHSRRRKARISSSSSGSSSRSILSIHPLDPSSWSRV